MKIDVHTHILPKNIPDFKKEFGYGGFIQLEHIEGNRAHMRRDDGQFFRTIDANCWDPELRIRECDRHGVDKQVLSTVPVMFSYWAKPQHGQRVSRFLNEHIADVVRRYPKRFIGLASIPLQDAELAIAELRYCKEVLGLSGAEIGTHVQGKNLDEEDFAPVFAAAEQLDMPLFIHPWDMLAADRMTRFWLPWLVGMPAELMVCIASLMFSNFFKRYPKLRVCFAHGGGGFCSVVGRWEQGYIARPDLCATHTKQGPKSQLRNFFVDSLTHDAQVLQQLIDVMGADRICLGTDYPFPLGETEAGSLIESMNLAAPIREQLLYKSAMKWLNNVG